MPQTWIVFSIVSGLFSVTFNYLNRVLLKDDHDSTAYSWWFELFRLIIFLPFFLLTISFPWSYHQIAIFILIGLSEFFSVYFYMKMHSLSELSISTTVTQLRLVWVPLFALIVFGEKLKTLEYIGILLIFLGQITFVFKKNASIDKGIKIAVVASIFAAVNNITFKAASGFFNPSVIVLAMTIPALLIFPVKMKHAKNRIISIGNRIWKKMLLVSILNAFSMFFLIKALEFGEVSRVSAVFQSMTALQVFVGIIFLNETKNLLAKTLGIFIVIVGVLLLINF